jgi:hypothetical protein
VGAARRASNPCSSAVCISTSTGCC